MATFTQLTDATVGVSCHAWSPDGSVLAGMAVLAGVDLVLGIACWRALARGWKLKA